jgi:hypothetical protein
MMTNRTTFALLELDFPSSGSHNSVETMLTPPVREGWPDARASGRLSF